jgi:hypothetical protein
MLSTADHQSRTKRSPDSPDGRQILDPCLLCGHERETEQLQHPEKEEEAKRADTADVRAQFLELECPAASPTDPPLHAGVRAATPPVAELAGLGLAESHAGELPRGHLFGPDQHKHGDIFGMHKPLWM